MGSDFKYIYRPWPLDASFWFGDFGHQQTFNPSKIAGFANITSIAYNSYLPHSIMALPTLDSLSLADPCFYDQERHTRQTHVTSLTLHINRGTHPLHQREQWAQASSTNIARMLTTLPSLTRLHLIISGEVTPRRTSNITPDFRPFQVPHLRTFIYDTRAVLHQRDATTPHPSPIETLFLCLVENMAEGENVPNLDKVEIWPGQYEGDGEVGMTLPANLLEWIKRFSIYIGDGDMMRRVGEGEVRTNDDWPCRVMYVKE
jgi:hypothetical protein